MDEIIAMQDVATNTYSYAHRNHQGSVVAVSNASGQVTSNNIYTYSPYGEVNSVAGFPFRYTGRRLDPETGLYYYRARYYDSGLGRFLQTDPIGYKDQMNLYAYVGNDPVNKIDPTGEIGQSYINSLRPNQIIRYTPAMIQAKIDSDRNSAAAYFSRLSDYSAVIAIGTSTTPITAPVAAIAGPISMVSGLAAGALKVKSGSLATAVLAEAVGQAAGSKVKPVAGLVGTIIGKIPNETIDRITDTASAAASKVASDTIQKTAENRADSNSGNDKEKSGMANGIVWCDEQFFTCR